MAEYIDRANLIARIKYYVTHTPEGKGEHYAYSVMLNEVLNCPAADVVPVVHGKWIRPHWKNSDYCCNCSECGGEAMHREYQWNKKGIYPICPNCGAKMDGECGS